MIDETTTRAVQRILAMRLAARGGRYTPAQKEFARSYAECAFRRVCRTAEMTHWPSDGFRIIMDEDHWFLMRASSKEFWMEDYNPRRMYSDDEDY